MEDTLRRMQERRADGDRGFTLIELLVVVVIIGVLVAIAIPVYMNYREGAQNKSVQADVRSAVMAVEQYYSENNNTYPSDTSAVAGEALTFGGQTATVSAGNLLQVDDRGTFYVICGINEDTGQVYIYNSQAGGAVQESAAADLAACQASVP